MNRISVLLAFIFSFQVAFAQTQSSSYNYPFGTCFSKGNQKSITKEMDKLLTEVSKSFDCKKEDISFAVDEYYTKFYTQECRHLPKQITFTYQGTKKTYIHQGLSGAILYWTLGRWKLLPA